MSELYVKKLEKQNQELVEKCKTLEEKLDDYISKYGELKEEQIPNSSSGDLVITSAATFTFSNNPVNWVVAPQEDKSSVYVGKTNLNERLIDIEKIKTGVDYLVDQYKIKSEKKENKMARMKIFIYDAIITFNSVISRIL